MTPNIVVLHELLLQGLGQINKCSTAISKLGVSAGAFGRKLNGAEEGKGGAAEVVRGVNMKEAIALRV